MNNKPNTKAEILKKLIEKRELDKPFELEDINEGYVSPIDKLQLEYKQKQRRKGMAWLAFLYPFLISAGVFLGKKVIRLGVTLISAPVLNVISASKNVEGELIIGFNVKKVKEVADKTPNNYDDKAVDILGAGADALYKAKGN